MLRLPNELILKIFGHLEYDDLLMVKKANIGWLNLVRCFIESRRVVVNQSTSRDYGCSFHSTEYLICNSTICFRMNTDLHCSIRDMILFHPFVLFSLTNFDNLQNLKIMLSSSFRKSKPSIFKLQNLKFLSLNANSTQEVNQTLYYSQDITLETPNLTKLKTNIDLNCFTIIHPRSIRMLLCRRTSSAIKSMTNLEELNCFCFDIVDDLLAHLKNLKFLIFFQWIGHLPSTIQYIEYNLSTNSNLKVYYKRIDFNQNPMKDDELLQTSNEYLDDQSLQVYTKFVDSIKETLNQIRLEIRQLENVSIEIIRLLKGKLYQSQLTINR